MKTTAETLQNGQIIFINKPRNWTSFDVVNKIRSDIRHQFQIPFIKIGHAGSLDPLATGLLILCCGKATKKIDKFQGLIKEYAGTFMLGATTPSYDMETQINERYSITNITPEMIRQTAKKFVGNIWQIPPTFSAKQIQGRRAYDIARSGGIAEVKPIPVNIKEFEITSIHLPLVEFRVVCEKGTYIRSLANDFGSALGCGAFLSTLCRTRIGKYRLKNSCEPKDWLECTEPAFPNAKPKKRISPKLAAKKAKERKKFRKKIDSGKVLLPASKLTKKATPKKKRPGKKKKK